MHEAAQHARLGHLLQVVAGLAELDADAVGLADGEAPPDQRIEVDSAREHVAARLGTAQLDAVLLVQALERFGLDERDVAALALLARGVGEVAVAQQALARERLDDLDGAAFALEVGGDVDRLHASGHGRKDSEAQTTALGTRRQAASSSTATAASW